MDSNRKLWNSRQKILRQTLTSAENHKMARELVLDQHAMVHSARMSKSGLYSFEDEILQDMSEKSIRCIPGKYHHSVAWIIWHMARIEDVTMNLLVAEERQVLYQDSWLERMRIDIGDTGNGMTDKDVADLSAIIDIKALKAYRLAVGRKTRRIIKNLEDRQLKQKVKPSSLQQIWHEQAMRKNAKGIVDYWSRRTIAGLLLMPPTRHCFLHLNEASRIKGKI